MASEPHPHQIREIVSPANSLLKVFRRALADGVTRDGLVALEGPMLLEEALKGQVNAASERVHTTVHSVLVSESAAHKFASLIGQIRRESEIARIPDRLFAGIAQTETPQGIAGLAEIRAPDLETALRHPDALLVIACGLQDPGNLGTILRSSQALGATALITLRGTVSPFNPKAVRSSAGAIFRLPLYRNQEPGTMLDRLKTARVQIVATDSRGRRNLVDTDLRGPVALLVGQEAAGLPVELVEGADLRLRIPIKSGTDSLNAAMAAGIFLYEAARQRGFVFA